MKYLLSQTLKTGMKEMGPINVHPLLVAFSSLLHHLLLVYLDIFHMNSWTFFVVPSFVLLQSLTSLFVYFSPPATDPYQIPLTQFLSVGGVASRLHANRAE
jgi:hypothetical protein